MGEEGTRDLDSKRRHPRQLTDTEREEMVGKVLTRDEQQVSRLFARGHSTKEIATELYLSDDAVRQHVQIIFVKLSRATRPDPPLTPLAASAALPVPRQRAEDFPPTSASLFVAEVARPSGALAHREPVPRGDPNPYGPFRVLSPRAQLANAWAFSGASSARLDRRARSVGTRHGNAPLRRGIAITATAGASGDPGRLGLTSAEPPVGIGEAPQRAAAAGLPRTRLSKRRSSHNRMGVGLPTESAD